MPRKKRARKPKVSGDATAAGVPDLAGMIAELDAIKRLLVLLLAKVGSGSPEIAMALGLEQSTVRRIVQFRSVKKLQLGSGAEE